MICDACKLGFHNTAMYPNCVNCGDPKPNLTAKLCEDCSHDLDQCEICRGPLPEPEDDADEVEPTDDELEAIEEEEADDEPEDDDPPDDGCGKDDC